MKNVLLVNHIIYEHKSQILLECDECTIYTTLMNKVKKARNLYQKQANEELNENIFFLLT